MKQQEARKLLGLENAMPSLTVDIVQEAFRARCKVFHPDTLAGATAEPLPAVHNRVAVLTMDQLTTARKMLLDVATGADLACKACSGRGSVPAKMGWRACSVCKGSGDKR